jgi:hypothetical protein
MGVGMNGLKLQLERDYLVVLMNNLDNLVSKAELADRAAHFQLRRGYGLALMRHLKHVLWTTYAPMLASEDVQIANRAREAVSSIGTLASSFSEYNREWTAFAIEAHWSDYVRETRRFLAAVKARLSEDAAQCGLIAAPKTRKGRQNGTYARPVENDLPLAA